MLHACWLASDRYLLGQHPFGIAFLTRGVVNSTYNEHQVQSRAMEHFNCSSCEDSSPCPLPSKDSTQSFWHSQPSVLLKGHRSTRNLPQTADVVIIGSGITGTSVAYNLLTSFENGNDEKGPSVVMLEAREACWGATGRVCIFYIQLINPTSL